MDNWGLTVLQSASQSIHIIIWNEVSHTRFVWLLPGSHLPRTPCDKFVYDFLCDFLGIVGGYGLRHMCLHCLRASCDFFYGPRGEPGVNPYRDCAEIVRKLCNVSAVSAASARKSYGARAGIGLHTVPVQGLCNATYDMSTVLRFFQICKTFR